MGVICGCGINFLQPDRIALETEVGWKTTISANPYGLIYNVPLVLTCEYATPTSYMRNSVLCWTKRPSSRLN